MVPCLLTGMFMYGLSLDIVSCLVLLHKDSPRILPAVWYLYVQTIPGHFLLSGTFTACSTSYCFCHKFMDPCNVCVCVCSLYKDCSWTLAAVWHLYVRTLPGH